MILVPLKSIKSQKVVILQNVWQNKLKQGIKLKRMTETSTKDSRKSPINTLMGFSHLLFLP